ncbi:class I SAM-dependent methyltransferase [Tundrisphaera sp. TA3]|uniref:class I SAM-dependent methyltransferase n=1 Tax=Tundrisphaera sp. TA3 TaxID=3435775 RepID=UPI003EBB171B
MSTITGPSARVGERCGCALVDPEDATPLRPDSPHSLVGEGGGRWPVVEGIPFLRVGREHLRQHALEALDSRDARSALGLLLADQDDFARTPPPDAASIAGAIDAAEGDGTLRDAMRALGFGPVADYFAYRWSAPTYLSGLALLGRHAPPGRPVVEVACGIGHYLRDLRLRGIDCLGLDVVFAKIWLARRFVVPGDVGLVCADAVAGWPLGRASSSPTVFCHDAFYFLDDKPGVVASFRRTAGDAGRILIGHAHNRDFDHRGVAGDPWTPEAYAGLLPGCRMYDDAELARWAWAETPAPARDAGSLAGVEAVALAWPDDGLDTGRTLLDPAPGSRPLRVNPLLVDQGGQMVPRWPSPRFEAEYAEASGYLIGEPTPPDHSRPERDEVARLARRRILLDLPERW